MDKIYGLTKKEYYELMNFFEKNSKDIKKVIIFGSRARGDYKKYSDIDIAVLFREKKDLIYNLIEYFEVSNLIYKVDVIDYNSIKKEALKKNIDNQGIVVFKTGERGEVFMVEEKLKYKLKEYVKAVDKLELSLKFDVLENELYRDGVIKRFEFCYELAWKLLKYYLELEGIEEPKSPRSTIREAFRLDLLDENQDWIAMIGDRNRTSHTYNEETAIEIDEKIKKVYINYFISLKNRMEELI